MKQHPIDPISLVFGGLLAALGGFLVSSDLRWESAGGAWALPVLLVVIGGAILWSTIRQLADTAEVEDELEVDGSEPPEYQIPEISDL